MVDGLLTTKEFQQVHTYRNTLLPYWKIKADVNNLICPELYCIFELHGRHSISNNAMLQTKNSRNRPKPIAGVYLSNIKNSISF